MHDEEKIEIGGPKDDQQNVEHSENNAVDSHPIQNHL